MRGAVSRCAGAALVALLTLAPAGTGSYVFSSNASTFDFSATSIAYMRGRGWRKIAIMTSTDAIGQDAERGIETAIDAPENAGTLSLVDHEHFDTTDLSVAAQIAHIKASAAQAAILWTLGTSFGTPLRAAVRGGLTIPLFTSAGNLSYAQLEGYAAFMPDDLYMAAPPWAAPARNPDRAAGVRPEEGEALARDPAALVTDLVHPTPSVVGCFAFGLRPSRPSSLVGPSPTSS